MNLVKDNVRSALERGHLINMTTTGRRSGRPRRIEIAFHNIEGRIYISGIPSPRRRSWLANLEHNPRLIFHLKGRTSADLPATARIIKDEDERRTVLSQVARNWGRTDVERMVRQSPLIEVMFDSDVI